jgi:hypothetical protein
MSEKEECIKDKAKEDNGKKSAMTEFASPLGIILKKFHCKDFRKVFFNL